MKEPSLFINAVCDLREHRKILGLEVLSILWSSKKETARSHVTFGVLPVVANSFGSPWQDFD